MEAAHRILGRRPQHWCDRCRVRPGQLSCVPPLGLFVIAWLTSKVFIGTEGSGIPQAIAALSMPSHAARSRVLSLKVAAGKILLTIMGLLSGASIGREGPTVHVGASIMYSLRRIAPFHGKDMVRALVLAGGAAGIAAAFNTPLAGVMFAIEEMSRSFEERNSGTLVIAVILAGITALVILGNYTYFGTSTAEFSPFSPAGWLTVLVCGVLGGLLGGSFSTILIMGSRYLMPFYKKHPLWLALICGLIISLVGWLSHGATFGTGYDQAKALVTANAPIPASSDYFLYKYIATVASYLSGIPGGIFAPSLSVGAGMGADLAQWLPASFAAVVLLSMVGYFSGVVQTPITALIIVMEMTDNSSMLMPLMATALIAKGISRFVSPLSIYEALAEAYLHKPKPKTTEQTEPEKVSS
ncbi:MAG: chloride channel protein [Gammaproteobacteria bacterium]